MPGKQRASPPQAVGADWPGELALAVAVLQQLRHDTLSPREDIRQAALRFLANPAALELWVYLIQI